MTGISDLLELVRAPAAISVPGDVVSGAAAAGALDLRVLGLAGGSVCLYLAGMAANDWADRDLDAVERPERPIPSGRVSPATALTVAAGLTGAGVALAALAGGRRSAAVAGGLAAAVWTYDIAVKNTAAGPLAMAACRGLDVLLGASTGPSPARALLAAAAIAAHTYLVTRLSLDEVTGTSPAVPAATLAGTAAVTAFAGRGGPAQQAMAGWYATRFGLAQLGAVADPSAARVRGAVGTGIFSLPALQGALTARAGAVRTGLAVAVAASLARRLIRRSSAT